jgi:hypothetical protein
MQPKRTCSATPETEPETHEVARAPSHDQLELRRPAKRIGEPAIDLLLNQTVS